MVGRGRFELPTSPLSGARSNQLSYRPLNNQMVIRKLGLANEGRETKTAQTTAYSTPNLSLALLSRQLR